MKDATFAYHKESKEGEQYIELENINLKIPKNSLTAVIGPIGSGKTTFIHALLDELYLKKVYIYIYLYLLK